MTQDELLRLSQVLSHYGVSKSTIYQWIKVAGFPLPVRFGPKLSRWRAEDLRAWDTSRDQGFWEAS